MVFELPLFLAMLAIAFVLATATAIFAITRRTSLTSTLLAIQLFAVAIWSGGYMVEILERSLDRAMIWAKIEYIGIVALAPGWMLFAMAYSQILRRFNRRLLVLVCIIPVTTLVLVWTNEFHGLIWREVHLSPEGILLLFTASYGPWFWVHTSFSYACIFSGSFLLLRMLMRPVYRAQGWMLVISAVLPVLANVVYLTGLSPLGRLDLTPLAFAISSTLLASATLGFRLLELIPVARSVVVEHLREGVVVIDRLGRVLDANPAALQRFRKRSSEIIGQPVGMFAPHITALLERYPLDSEASEEIHTTTDREYWDHIRLIPVSDVRGRIRARMVVWHDITEIRRATAELERARGEAEAANRAKSAFLANMSHELRTPLTAILGYAQLMKIAQERGDHERIISDLESVAVAGNHLLTLIDGILNLAKIEADREIVRIEPANLRSLVDDAIRSSRSLIETNGNRLELRYATPLSLINTDALKLRQILINLLGNAAKFTQNGVITLQIENDTHPEDGWLTIQVHDTGIGIEPAHLLHLFEAFRQADASTTKRYGGTGLGLTISRRYVEMLGGNIAVWSEPGKGSTFTVRLPNNLPVSELQSA